ncbi:MAG: adaptor protein MecA [Clostridia bacterium]|nr:adaptor protein MecA [Clostridia bacterium]
MELIRISNSKLKIMLTPMDMRQFELSTDNFYDDSEKMHRSFRLLLDEVKRQSGFEADDHRISVQYFPSREGGCEMFISNLSGDKEKGSCALTPAQEMQPAPRTRGSFSRSFAYRFDGLDELLSVCRRLLPMDYINASSAWRDDGGQYYLFLNTFAASPFATPEELYFVVEYGTIENASQLRLYLAEHGTVLCAEDAIGKLGTIG